MTTIILILTIFKKSIKYFVKNSNKIFNINYKYNYIQIKKN